MGCYKVVSQEERELRQAEMDADTESKEEPTAPPAESAADVVV